MNSFAPENSYDGLTETSCFDGSRDLLDREVLSLNFPGGPTFEVDTEVETSNRNRYDAYDDNGGL